MAALIFDSVGKLCAGCGSLCHNCGEACEGCCSVLALPIRKCGDGARTILCSPFFPYLALTALCNGPPLLDVVLQQHGKACHWLIVNAVICGIHILASLYISYTLETKQILVPAVVTTTAGSTTDDGKGSYDSIPATNTTQQQHYRDSPMERMKQVLCYDPGVAVYIIVILFWMVWLAYGFEQAVLGGGSENYDEDPTTTTDEDDGCAGPILTAMFAGGTYATLVVCSLGCALACMK